MPTSCESGGTRAGGQIVDLAVLQPGRVLLRVSSGRRPCARAQIVDLAAPELAPEGWVGHARPGRLAAPTDASIYELHVRDFSASDATVPAPHRGKYAAFAQRGTAGARPGLLGPGAEAHASVSSRMLSAPRRAAASRGAQLAHTAAGDQAGCLFVRAVPGHHGACHMHRGRLHAGRPLRRTARSGAGCAHLEELAAAGLTHVHLLPAYAFGSVPERGRDQLQPQARAARGPAVS